MRSNNIWIKIASFLLVVIMLGAISVGIWLGVETDGFRDWSYFNDQTEQPDGDDDNEETPSSGVTDGEGNEMASGTAYALPRAMVYAAPTAQSETASEGVTVTATVLPETALDKSVTWSVAFADAESEWAAEKDVSDYLTVTPDEDDSRIAVLTCEQAFGEQIILTAASVANPEVTATCTIDYAQTVTSVTVKIGNIDVVLGGNTDVTVDIGHNNTDRGGEVTVEYTLSEVYTLAESGIETNVGLTYESGDASGQWVAYSGVTAGSPGGSTYALTYSGLESAVGETIYFDTRIFDQFDFAYTVSSAFAEPENDLFADMDISEVKDLLAGRTGKILWSLNVSVSGKYKTYTAQSDIVLSEIDGWAEVEDIQLDKDEIIFQ